MSLNKKPIDYRQLFAIRNDYKKRILKLLPEIKNKSGIYIYHRIDERGFKNVYVGKAKKLINRLIDHFMEYDHIANSLRTYGLINEKDFGWNIDYFYCDESELDKKETETLAFWHIEKGYAPYNINTGGTSGKKDIKPRTVGGYRKGVDVGYQRAIKEIAELLKRVNYTFEPKKNKNGSLNVNSKNALNKLNEIIGGLIK